MYIIEKNVPITQRSGRYPFDQMGIGDSFFIPKTSGDEQNRVLMAANTYKRILNTEYFKISTRKEKEGLRVWRIS